MEYNDLIDEVRNRAQFESLDDAAKVTNAVFEILGKRLSQEQSEKFVGLLPAKLKEHFQQKGNLESLVTEEFLPALGRREGVDITVAGYHARAVLSALATGVSGDELRDVLVHLPEDIRDLFMIESWVKEVWEC